MGNDTADVKIRILTEDHATKELRRTDSALSGFGDVLKGVGVVAGVATAAVVAFNKALDFGEAGAKAEQMANSFDYLMKKVGAAPDILDQLRDASRGTISDLDLMASTSLLLAGTQGELATELANATPQLLEMAKAAEKLNPSLGDTTFLYDSLARGIKRGSPMILDNLGIMVSLEEANKKYADSLGVSVDALSKEQQQVALLNEVLGKGNVLIEQAGGNVDSASDEYAQFRVNIENAANSFKQDFNPAIKEAVGWINELMTWTEKQRVSFREQSQELAETTDSFEDYVNGVVKMAEEYGFMVKLVDNSLRIFQLQGQEYKDITAEVGYLTEGFFESKEAIRSYTGEVGMLGRALGDLPDDISDVTAAQQDLNLALEAGLKAGLDGKLATAMGDFSEAMQPLKEQLLGLQTEMANLFVNGLDPTSEEFITLQGRMADVRAEMEPLQDALAETTKELIYNQAAAGLDAEAALELARSFGLLSEQDYVVATSLQNLRDSFDANKDGAITAAEGAEAYTVQVQLLSDAIALLQQKGAEVTFENLAAAIQQVGQTDTSGAAKDLDNTATSASDLLEIFGETPDAVGDAEQSIDDIGTTLNSVANNDVQNMISQLQALQSKIASIPRSIHIRISQSGAQSLLNTLDKIKKEISALEDAAAALDVPAPPAPTATPTTTAPTINVNNAVSVPTELDAESFTYLMASRLQEYID